MDEKSWRDGWEEESQAEKARYDATPVSDLLSNVRDGRVGQYFGIWYSIALRSTPAEAGWPLYRALLSQQDYFHQFHCAAALLHLLGLEPFVGECYPVSSTAHTYASNATDHAQAREALEKWMIERIGGRP